MIESLKTPQLQLIVWMNMPSHHQSAFFREIQNQGVDLMVCYYGVVDAHRKSMGWDADGPLSDFERFFSPEHQNLETLEDWRDRVHIVPGYGSQFLRRLVRELSTAKVKWIHWSERSHPGLRWYLTYPIKRWYARMVNNHAIGAFGCGNLAIEDFIAWGIRRELLGILPYSPEYLSETKNNKLELLKDAVKSRRVFLYVGCLEHRKGIDLLLKAFAEVSKLDDNSWILKLIGNDLSNGSYTANAKKLGIESIVSFSGVIPYSQIAADYMNASVLILPSRFDGWGAVVNEGAAHGKALIVSDQCGAAQHLVDAGVNGFVVKAGDWRSLAHAMRAYIVNPELADRHGKASYMIYERFSPASNAKRFIEMIHSWSTTTNDELS